MLVGASSHQQGKALRHELTHAGVCPMSGCEGAELAAGALGDAFAAINSTVVLELTQDIQGQLSPEQWSLTLRDFELGCSHLHLRLQVIVWEEEPLAASRTQPLGHGCRSPCRSEMHRRL